MILDAGTDVDPSGTARTAVPSRSGDVVRVTRRQKRQLATLAAIVLALLFAIPGRKGWFDIGVYHDAVTYWVKAPGHLYDFISPGTPYGFTYPPFAAVCMLPMSLFGWHTTIALNIVVSAVASAFLLYVLVDPIARREGWNRWYAFGVAACLFSLIEPVRDTIGYGQINLVLVALVYTDLLLMNSKWSGFTGVGTGIAAAIKLTPGIFILYFVLTGRWRAAAFSAGTMITATAVAAILAPGATLTYFTKALWDTNRIGVASYVSNQSLMGVVARLNPAHPNHLLWIALVAVVMGAWAWRVRVVAAGRSAAGSIASGLAASGLGAGRGADGLTANRRNDRIGFALTGLTACLISPITWVHHLVWLIPGLVELISTAAPFLPYDRQRRRRLWFAFTAYLLLCSDVVWIWWKHDGGVIGFVGSNLYVFICLGLLFWLPIGAAVPTRLIRPRIPPQLVRAIRSQRSADSEPANS